MADDPGVQFFTDAKAQYESTGRWRWVVVALLAYLQFGLVTPFVADTRAKSEIDRQLADSREAEKALKPIVEKADTLTNSVNSEKDSVATELKQQLVRRFQTLSEAIRALDALGPSRAKGEEGEAIFEGRLQQQQQQQQQNAPDPSALPPMDPDLRQKIAEKANVGASELPPDLQRYIASAVIPPPFTNANTSWRDFLNTEQDYANAIVEGAAKAEGAAPIAKTELRSLAETVKRLNDGAMTLDFSRAPPADSTWWRSVGGKEQTILSMTADLARRVNDLDNRQTTLRALAEQIDETVKKKAK